MIKTLNDVLLLYVQAKKGYLKESTYARYCNLIKNHIRDTIGKISMEDLSNKKIQLFCDKCISLGKTLIVIKEIVLLIKLAIKRDAKICGIQPLYIDLDLPPINRKKKIQILTRKEQKTLFEYVMHNNIQKYSGIVLSLMTGIRIGELCALKWKNIDLKKRIITVERTLQRVCFKGEPSKIIITKPTATKIKLNTRDTPIELEPIVNNCCGSLKDSNIALTTPYIIK